ncbi:MAG: hypothetical protein O7F16_11395 [Acidobacteria bacterium]|nr:hypothetical protein [Acidobacteriota bacterium]
MRDWTRPYPPRLALLICALLAGLIFSTWPVQAGDWLVLPFANQSDEPALDWLGEGFAISLEEHLRSGGQAAVPYDETRELLSKWNVPRGQAVTLATALKAAEITGVSRVVTGSFTVAAGKLSVDTMVLDPLGPEVLGEVHEDIPLGNLFDLHAGLARAVWRAGRKKMPSFRPFDQTVEALPITAYERYIRARLEADPGKRLKDLRKAAASFPTYALLQYRLAEALDEAGKQDEALNTLARLHPARFLLTPDAYLLEGELRFRDEDPVAAEQAVLAALEIQDSAHGRLLHAEILLKRGLEDQARSELERSRKLGLADEEYEALSIRMDAPDDER